MASSFKRFYPSDLWWVLAALGLVAIKPAPLADGRAAGSLALLCLSGLLLPLIQNAIYIFLIDLVAGRRQAHIRISIVAALAAAGLQAIYSTGVLFLFGSYFIFAAVYLAWREEDRSFGFWFGVLLHVLFNAPAATIAFLG
ncbi:MAG TPA: hypothetical protein VKQ29_04990 [Aliidongia sp.]|nr:hypothetical protein [Aliidongia sp.]